MFDRNNVWSALYLVTHQRTRTQPQDARGMKIPFLCAVTLTLYLCGMDNRREVNVKCSGRQFIDQAHVFLCTFLQSCNCHAIVGKRFALFTIILYRLVCCFVFDLDYCRGCFRKSEVVGGLMGLHLCWVLRGKEVTQRYTVVNSWLLNCSLKIRNDHDRFLF